MSIFDKREIRVDHISPYISIQSEVAPQPDAMRYGFDGYGFKYIDSGSGSDWQTRHPDAEPLFITPQPDELRQAQDALNTIGTWMAWNLSPKQIDNWNEFYANKVALQPKTPTLHPMKEMSDG